MWLVGTDIASATLCSNYIHQRVGIGVTPTSKESLPSKSSDPIILCCRYSDSSIPFFKKIKSLLVRLSKRTPLIILLVGMYTRTDAELIDEARAFRIEKYLKNQSTLRVIGYISEPSDEQLYIIKACVPIL